MTETPSVAASVTSANAETASSEDREGETQEASSQVDAISFLQANPPSAVKDTSRAASATYSDWEIPSDVGGDSPTVKNFYVYNYYNTDTGYDTIASTCRSVVTIDGITLAVFVADDSWTTTSELYKVDSDMVDALADTFLKSGDDNDIYDWVTGLYGDPWGDHSYSNVLPSSAKSYITILLTDIYADNSEDGGVVGFYNSTDNFYNSENYTGGEDYSNERLMFYMDSVMFANSQNYENDEDVAFDEGTDWDMDDYWPETIFSTLAHEFQHMIHFYQKSIVNKLSTYSSTWFNEMCSVVTEDLVSFDLGVTGPRGYLGDYPSDPDLSFGRLPTFNYWDDESLEWYDSDEGNYSTVYAFGAFLARNYGGAELFREMVQSNLVDEKAIVSATGASSLEALLIEWGEALLSSDEVTSGSEPGYNKSYSSTIDGSYYYDLYPINLENYIYTYKVGSVYYSYQGPWIYDGSLPTYTQDPASNLYYQAAEGVTGEQVWTVEIPSGITLTVVQKDS
jgi:hypothetical protein